MTEQRDVKCNAVLMVRGERYECDWPTDEHGNHPGWAHACKELETLWIDDPRSLTKLWAM